MNDFLLVIIALLILYAGNFLGIVMFSHQMPSLKPMRHWAGAIPLLRISFFIYILITPREEKVKYILTYIFHLKHKNIVFAECLAMAIEARPEHSRKEFSPNPRKVAKYAPVRRDVFSSIGGLVRGGLVREIN